jgi:DNA replication and repair protein RecF
MTSSRAIAIRHLTLGDFRTYARLDLAFDGGLIAFCGENGVGKTNILEALSFLTPGRGLRRCNLAEPARFGGHGGWAVSVRLESALGETQIGTGIEPPADGEAPKRLVRIDREALPSPAALSDYLRLVWLTPDQDGLFRGAAGDRRRFLDRLVLAIDAAHGTRVNALERALRSRNRLLEEGSGSDPRWLDAIEREVAETAIAVSAARRETVERLASLIMAKRNADSPFPWARLELVGEIENALAEQPAGEVEDRYRSLLRQNRERDRAAGRTLIGPQTSDLSVFHGPKNVMAELASTGEQKALLVGLVLAHAQLVAEMSGMTPLILLDEVAAHLDPRRRLALYEALETLNAQVFMTGADEALFSTMPIQARRFVVTPGCVDPL